MKYIATLKYDETTAEEPFTLKYFFTAEKVNYMGRDDGKEQKTRRR